VIPHSAIEAAKEAMREVTPPPGVSKSDWLAEHGDFALIAGAIAAAAPHMLAGAWDEGCEEGLSYNPGFGGAALDENPYR
jgi:hypothetical protein